MDQLLLSVPVDFLAEIINVYIHEVGPQVEINAPYMLQDINP
jgi:hypothetical protein